MNNSRQMIAKRGVLPKMQDGRPSDAKVNPTAPMKQPSMVTKTAFRGQVRKTFGAGGHPSYPAKRA